ncbi:hypothetical protein, unknown function [Leishmania tarentolae]|uniref:Proteophosphoglycan ppg4 n=1 Tax=Leishmania tarentolae TaxID=5689 RepID=A0A640KA00_LEITA|nr:hypothetical protein, unknown function [Leishmania tarentolae]
MSLMRQQRLGRPQLLLLAVAMATMAAAAGESIEGIHHDLWWWIALVSSGFFTVVLMFMLLFFWSRSLAASASVPASSRHSMCHQLERRDSAGPFDGPISMSLALTAMRHTSTDVDGRRRGSGEASVSSLPYTDHISRYNNDKLMAAVLEGGDSPLPHYGGRPAPRTPVKTAALLAELTPKKSRLTSPQEPSNTHSRSAVTVAPRTVSAASPAVARLPQQRQLSPAERPHRLPNDLGGAMAEADTHAAVRLVENPLAGAGLQEAWSNLLVPQVGGSALHPTSAAAAVEGKGDVQTRGDVPADELTFSGVSALAWDGKAARKPTPQAPPQRGSSSNGVKQYYFGFKYSQDTAATATSSELIPRRAGRETTHTPPQRRSSQARQPPVEVHSEPAPDPRREVPLTSAPTTTAAASAHTSSTPPQSAVFQPLALTLMTTPPVSASKSSNAASLTEMAPLLQKRHVTDEDGAAQVGLDACRRSHLESHRVSSLSGQRLPQELCRVSGEGDHVTVKAAASGAQLDKCSVAQLRSGEERPTRQLLTPHAGSEPANSKPRRQWRDSPLSSQPPASSRSGVASCAAQRAASTGSATEKMPAGTTVTKGVPQLFFGKRGASPVRPPAGDVSSQSTTKMPNETRGSSGGTNTRQWPIAKPLSVEHLAQPLQPALVSRSALSCGSPQSRAAAADTVTRRSSTPVKVTPTGDACISSPSRAAGAHRGSFNSSMKECSPLCNSPGRKRSSSHVTFLDKDGARAGSETHGGHAPPPLTQQPQLPQPCKLPAGSPSSFYTSPPASGSAGAARLERLPDPVAATPAASADVSPVAPDAGMTIAQGHPSFMLPSATAALERHREENSSTREPSVAATATPPHSAATATPLEIPMDMAGHRAPVVWGPPALLSTRQRGGGTAAAAALTSGVAEESSGTTTQESCDGDDGDSVSSRASTVAAGMLPAAPHGRRGASTMVPPPPTVASQQQQLRSTAPAYSDAGRQFSRTSRIEVLRITHPTDVAQESPATFSAVARHSRHHDLMHTASHHPSTKADHHLHAAHSNTALPARSPVSEAQVVQASATRSSDGRH